MWWLLAGIVCFVILLDAYLSARYLDDEDRE